MFNQIIESILKESDADFPQYGLDLGIWQDVDGKYILRNDVKEKVIQYIKSISTSFDLIGLAKEIHLVGSMCTNLYIENTDIDIHIICDDDKLESIYKKEDMKMYSDFVSWKEDFQRKIKKWQSESKMFVEDHPIEIYIQLNPSQDLFGDGAYDFLNDVWLKGPEIYPFNYNPYEIYKDIIPKIEEYAKNADINIGELKRRVVDYESILKAFNRLHEDDRKELKKYLEEQLKLVEDGIDKVLKNKKEWVDLRKNSSKTADVDQALNDVKLAQKFKNANVIFKFLNRYNYIGLISEIEKISDEKGINDDSIKLLSTILK